MRLRRICASQITQLSGITRSSRSTCLYRSGKLASRPSILPLRWDVQRKTTLGPLSNHLDAIGHVATSVSTLPWTSMRARRTTQSWRGGIMLLKFLIIGHHSFTTNGNLIRFLLWLVMILDWSWTTSSTWTHRTATSFGSKSACSTRREWTHQCARGCNIRRCSFWGFLVIRYASSK